jgi:hypothetical protein
MHRSSKKKSQSQSLNPTEAGIATRVEKEINIFFSESNALYKKINVDDFHNNIDNMKNYINYLNYNIKNKIQELTDVNFSKNGIIIEILNDDDITSDIKIKYEKIPDKYYSSNLKIFIKHIYIFDNKIFYLMPFKFRKTNTPIFNTIRIESVNIIELLLTIKQQSLQIPIEQICNKDLFKERYNINKDNNSLYKLKYNDNDLFKYVFFINMLKKEIKSNNIDLIDCYYEKFGKIRDIKLESKILKIQYFKDSNVNYYDIPLDMFINNIYIENSNKIYYLIENSSDSIKIINLIDYIYTYINLYEYIKEIFKNFNNEYYIKMFISNESYLNNIFSTNLSNIQTVFENTFIYLNNNIEEAIYIYCNKITDNKEKALQTILELINNYLFYIYQYYIVIEHYKLFLQSSISNKNIQNFYVYMKTSNFDTYLDYIIYQFNIDINIFKKSIKEKNLTVYKLNNTVLRNITPFKYPANKLDIINNKSLLIDYIRSTKSSINYLNIISSDDYNENNVITIPQYQGICWFIAMITGITYSDYSRNLLYSKRLRVSNNFIKFIYNIIENITNEKKAYSINLNKIDMSNCDLLKYLKEAPIYVLKDYIVNYALINKLHEDPHKQDIKNMFIKILQNNRNESITLTSDIIYKYIQNNLDTVKYLILHNILQDKTYELNTNNIDNAVKEIWCDFIENISTNINSFTKYGIKYYHRNILENFYNLLDIKSLFFYINKTDRNIKLYTKSLKPIAEYKSYDPDIIILNTGYSTSVLSELIDHDIRFDSNYKTIIFNDVEYKLDYMLHGTDASKTCINCGHCICALEYYGVQYIHDSRNIRYLLKCNDDVDYSIPCYLIKNNWKDNIFTDKCYSINTCGYLNKDGLNSSTILQNISRPHLCYGYDNSYTFVYVKITSSLASVSNNRSRSRSSRSRSY